MDKKDQFLWLLQGNSGIANQRLKAQLEMDDKSFLDLRQELLNEKIIETYRCRGGGLKLAKATQKNAIDAAKSTVKQEKDLYLPYAKILKKEFEEYSEQAIVINTSPLRRRGKWSNPDITTMAVQNYRLQKTKSIKVVTYELKQWGKWGLECVYEAASQLRMAHEAYLVLEWTKNLPVSGIDDIEAACGRYGVGLITLHKHYNSFRQSLEIEATPHQPAPDEVEEYLQYLIDRNHLTEVELDNLWDMS